VNSIWCMFLLFKLLQTLISQTLIHRVYFLYLIWWYEDGHQSSSKCCVLLWSSIFCGLDIYASVKSRQCKFKCRRCQNDMLQTFMYLLKCPYVALNPYLNCTTCHLLSNYVILHIIQPGNQHQCGCDIWMYTCMKILTKTINFFV
jgi:hypothetical protein